MWFIRIKGNLSLSGLLVVVRVIRVIRIIRVIRVIRVSAGVSE